MTEASPPPAPVLPTGKRARRKAERPGEILAAALTLFMRDGYTATRIEDVARLCGVTKGTVYVYFETKEALLAAVLRHFAPGPEGDPEPDLTSPGDIGARLCELVLALHDRMVEDETCRRFLHFTVTDGRHFPDFLDEFFAEFFAPALGNVQALLREGVRRGQLRPSIYEEAPHLLLAPSLMASLWVTGFGARRMIDHRGQLRAALELTIAALRSPGGQGRDV